MPRTLMESISVSVGRKYVGFSDVVKKMGIVWNGMSLVPSQALENTHSFGLRPGIHFKVTLVLGRMHLLPVLEN